MAPKKPPSKDTKAKPKPPKYKNIPTGLAQSHIDDLDAIAKTENLTRSEVVRRAVEEFVANYNADKLDARQSQLEKRMKTMETALRALLVKSIRLNGQVLYFTVLPYTHGIPKQRLSAKGFQTLYEKSAYFAGQFLQSKAASKIPSDLDFTDAEEQDEQAGEKSE
jgi:hypothetical protein